MLPFILGTLVGATGYKIIKEQMKDEEVKRNIEDIGKDISNLWDKSLKTTKEQFNLINKEIFKKQKKIIKQKIKEYNKEEKQIIFDKINNIKQTYGKTIKGNEELYKLYISLHEF